MFKRIYVIGPVTGIEDDNRPAFEEARKKLRSVGYWVEIPHVFVPSGAPHDEAMRISINALTSSSTFFRGNISKYESVYQGVAVLPGWEDSQGALCEHLVAEQCGIPCKTVDEWLEEAR